MRLSPPVRAAAQRLALPMLVFVSAMLMILGKADILVIDKTRAAVADALSPVMQDIVAPLSAASAAVARVEDAVAVFRENATLREENARLLQWQETARRLAAENASLRDLTKLVPDQNATSLAARVIGDSGGAFLRNVLVDAGAQDGVARGEAAMTGEGLIGRVSEVGERTARILLLTDLNSHIPVMVERTSERALLDGDNSDRPLLSFLESKAQIVPGDRIVTSGAGGVFPPSLPVGIVSDADNGIIRVEPYADLSRLDFVRLVDYGLEGLLPQSAIPPPKAPRARGRGTVDAER
jgi:rod shape-determining protein MreC